MQILHNYFFLFRLPYTFYGTLLFMCGIVAQASSYGLYFFNPYAFMCAMCVAIGSALSNIRWGASIALALLFFCLGALLFDYQINKQQQLYQNLQQKKATITGTVCNIVHDHTFPRKTKIDISITTLLLENGASVAGSAGKTIALYTSYTPEIEIDDTLEVSNAQIANEPSREFKYYLAREDICATFFITKQQLRVVARPTYSYKRWFAQQKTTCFDGLAAKMSRRCFSFFSSLFCGNKKTNKHEMTTIKQDFKRWGISHYLARSGLHMIIFVAIWQLLFVALPLNILYKELLLIVLAVCYALFTVPSVSFNRAILAFLCYKCCTILGKQSHGLAVISLVTLLLLLYNPISLFFLDFQLSFGLAFLLAWINQITTQQRIHYPLLKKKHYK